MADSWRGSCLCGAIRFDAEAFAPDAAHCHCSMCRKFHGAAFATYVSIPRARFRWTAGEEALQAYTASNGTTRRFCSHCGSSLSFEGVAASDEIEIALASFDGELPVSPDAHIWVGSGAAWATPSDALPQYEAGRDGPRIRR